MCKKFKIFFSNSTTYIMLGATKLRILPAIGAAGRRAQRSAATLLQARQLYAPVQPPHYNHELPRPHVFWGTLLSTMPRCRWQSVLAENHDSAASASNDATPIGFDIGVDGVSLRCRPGNLPEFHGDTCVFVATSASTSAEAFMRARNANSDPALFVLLDAPGMGKTATIAASALATGSVFVRFLASNGIMWSARSNIEAALQKEAARRGDGLVDPAIAEAIGVRAWRIALAACMDRCREMLPDGGPIIGVSRLNGVNFDLGGRPVDEVVSAAHTALHKAVADGAAAGRWAPDAAIVLHFDEIHALFGSGPKPQERSPRAPSTPAVFKQYILVWLSTALRLVCYGRQLKPVITGISVDASSSLRFDSSIKLWRAESLPYFTAEMTEELLRHHLHFSSPGLARELSTGVSGCPRAAQHLLQIAKNRGVELANGARLQQASVAELVAEAADSWRKSGFSSFLAGEARHLPAAEEAFLATCFPKAWDATPASVGGVGAAAFPIHQLPASWREAADAGVIRMRVDGDRATVFPPYPFLERYIRTLGICRLNMDDAIAFVNTAHLFPRLNGSFGRGKAFEFAAALELSLPGSPLLKLIFASVAAAGLQLSPYSRSVMPVKLVRSADDLGAVSGHVALSVDGVSATKVGDIAVPVLIAAADGGLSTKAWLFVQVKSSLTKDNLAYVRSGLSAFVQRVGLDPAVRVACYLTTLDPRPVGEKRVPGSVSALARLNKAKITPKRAAGLAVATAEVLASCTLPLAPFLNHDPAADSVHSFAQAVRVLFSDHRVRHAMAQTLRQYADGIEASHAEGTAFSLGGVGGELDEDVVKSVRKSAGALDPDADTVSPAPQ